MEVSDRILLGNGWYRLWGLSFLVACLPFTLAFDSAPIPPTPFPAGRGRLRLFYARGFAPCIPGGWVGCGTGFACGKRVVAGGLLFWLPANSALQVPRGGLLSLPPADAAFSLLSRPHPPDPLPGGKGETKVISCKGLRPLHPRGWVRCGTGVACGKRDTAGGLPGRHWGMVGAHASGGGACFLCRLPTLPLAFDSAPIPPDPLPLRGRGRFFVFLCKGLRPLHSRGLGGMRHWICLWKAGYGGGLAFFAACRLRLAGTLRGLAFLVACRRCL